MLNRQRLTVHRVRQQCIRIPGFGDAETAFETDLFRFAGHVSGVGAAEHQLAGTRGDPGPIEHLDQRYTRPLRGAHRAQTPLLAGDRRG